MNTFDIQGIEIRASRDRVFEFVRDPRNLPRWTHAFKSADDECARLQTPSGVVDVRLHTSVEATAGTVDRRLDSLTGASDSLNRASPTQAEAPASTASSCMRRRCPSSRWKAPSRRNAYRCGQGS